MSVKIWSIAGALARRASPSAMVSRVDLNWIGPRRLQSNRESLSKKTLHWCRVLLAGVAISVHMSRNPYLSTCLRAQVVVNLLMQPFCKARIYKCKRKMKRKNFVARLDSARNVYRAQIDGSGRNEATVQASDATGLI